MKQQCLILDINNKEIIKSWEYTHSISIYILNLLNVQIYSNGVPFKITESEIKKFINCANWVLNTKYYTNKKEYNAWNQAKKIFENVLDMLHTNKEIEINYLECY